MEDKENKLQSLRDLMKSHNYDCYIIPHSDQHDNEYISEVDERIKFISNFSGDNGIGLVTQDIALMWTDGRFYISIEKELYKGWKMMKMQRDEITLTQYIIKNIPINSKIGMDFKLFSKNDADNIILKLNKYEIIDDKENIIDLVWKNKPEYKIDNVIILNEEFTGCSVNKKFSKIKENIFKELKIDVTKDKDNFKNKKFRYLICRLDSIAWITNLRGNDIPYNPVFFAYAVLNFNLDNDDIYLDLFSNKKKYETEEIKNYLKDNKINLYEYEEINNYIKNSNEYMFIYDSCSTNYRMCKIITEKENKIENIELTKDIIEHTKYIKNETELKGMEISNKKDCIALLKFFAWIENELINKQRKDLNEYEIGLKSNEFREKTQKNYMGESFHPICGSGSNAAIIHYEQTKEINSLMSLDKVLLLDTGGQYKEGTTDITRTLHFGNATKKEKEFYTRVLLGNLSLERCIFKKGKSLRDIDIIPRFYLNIVGEDYMHGTSHGVGHFLNVHEGPYGYPLVEGYVMTNEPGYYEKDAFGIRIENSVKVVNKGDGKLGFENITYLPYERNLFDMDLISNDFKNYINDYHKKVFEMYKDELKDDEMTLDYLKRKTDPI